GHLACLARATSAGASRFAHYLIALGVGPETLVAIALGRSPELVVALLAVLKAGAAYLPLDLDYPAARMEQILADAAPAVVLSIGPLASRLPRDVEVINLDRSHDQTKLNEAPSHNPSDTDRTSALHCDHRAYVIYTSGSTGTPKGVVIRHRELVNYLSWASALFKTDGDAG